MKLILASRSPRRVMLMEKLGKPFQQLPADIDEAILKNESPEEYVLRLSKEKAITAATALVEKSTAEDKKNTYTVGSDVTVEIDGQSLAKPESEGHAKEMLMNLSGRDHYIRNGVAIARGREIIFAAVETAVVSFAELGEDEVDKYISESDEWKDKAGSYAIQSKEVSFVKALTGSYYTVVGLPIYLVIEVLRSYGFELSAEITENIRKEEKSALNQALGFA
jgi:septum formation protein